MLDVQAPVHFLVIPKQRDGLTKLSKSEERHEKLLGHLLFVASKVAKQGDTCACALRFGARCAQLLLNIRQLEYLLIFRDTSTRMQQSLPASTIHASLHLLLIR